VEDAVQAMRLGAVSVLEKPYNADQLAEAICESAALSPIAQATKQRLAVLCGRLKALDPREREVMAMVVDGMPTKTIARKLNVCHRTAAQIRADVFEKMEAGSAIELAIMASDLWRFDSARTRMPVIAPVVAHGISGSFQVECV
jgi:two-component system response regulator FixJ